MLDKKINEEQVVDAKSKSSQKGNKMNSMRRSSQIILDNMKEKFINSPRDNFEIQENQLEKLYNVYDENLLKFKLE